MQESGISYPTSSITSRSEPSVVSCYPCTQGFHYFRLLLALPSPFNIYHFTHFCRVYNGNIRKPLIPLAQVIDLDTSALLANHFSQPIAFHALNRKARGREFGLARWARIRREQCSRYSCQKKSEKLVIAVLASAVQMNDTRRSIKEWPFPHSSEHRLQGCQLRALRWDMWPEPIPLE